jgi:putative drug exporter of the RND superfamily
LITPLARFAVRHAVPVLVGWVVIVAALGLAARSAEDRVQPSLLFVPGTESTHWRDVRKGSFNESLIALLVGPAAAIDKQGPRLATALQARPGTRAISPWSANVKQLQALRPSPTQAAISIDLKIPPGGNINTVVGPLERFVQSNVRPPLRAHVAGIPSLGSEVNKSSIEALHKGEMIAIPILILVVLLVFRSPIAAAIPLLIAGGTVVMGFGVISLIAARTSLDAVALSAASMLGLALGVDYSLLIVTRFRSSLAEGHPPRQAASIAANTAGRTASFAGMVLLAITVVAFLLSPGSILLSMAIGMSVVTVLSMLGAILLAPAMTSLLGHRVNRWQFGGAPSEEGGLIARIVARVSGRAALATGLLAALLLVVAAPVLGIQTTPPDPRVLPKNSEGLKAFDALRAAHFGPEIDVALAAPNGTLLDPGRLQKITDLEHAIARLPLIKAVTGPGLIADATAGVRRAPKQIGKSRKDLVSAQDELTARSRQLNRARKEARRQADDVARGLQSAQALLNNGSSLLAAAGSHTGDVNRLRTGLTAAQDGATQLASGTRTLSSQAKLLAGALGEVQKRVDSLVPAIVTGQTALRDAEARLSVLRVPAQTSARDLQAALAALDRAGAAASQDPAVQEARADVNAALTAVAGSASGSGLQAAQAGGYGGLDAALAAELALAEVAGKQIDAAVRQAGQFADVMQQLADGAGRLVTPGLSTVQGGEQELAAALGQANSGVAAVQPQLDALAGGAQSLLSTGGELLNASGARATPLLTQLQQGLGSASSRIDTVRDQLANRTGPFQPLRTLHTLQLDSPGFFQSGYLVAAGLDGARPAQRGAIAGIIDSANGGRKARILVMPNVPTNDPRQDHIVDAVRALTHRFQRDTGIQAPVGGTAPELTDFERVNRTRVPLLIIAICLVTYLALIPILRSVVLPAIAVGLNLLTVSAAFGILTLLFVGDNAPLGGAGKLDVVTVTGIFVVTFALSIDYQVFLLTRMREEYVRTQSHTAAVEFGISKTARVVTGAAAIMVSVFVAFALSSFSLIQQLGIGLASAVLIDATIVRLGLLPSIMKMAGDRTWWLPTWLDEKLPYLDTEGSMFARDADHLRAIPGE